MEQISLKNITKKYNDKVVLNKIDKNIHKEQSIAFVGHNGCGKSTLLKIIAKIVAPTNGSVVYGSSLRFGYVPEKFPPSVWTARSYLIHMGNAAGLDKKEARKRTEALGDDFFLSGLLDVPMRSLSKGSLQKVGVIQALLKTPDVLLLDEPISGQDVESQKVFIDKVNRLRSQGVTVLMSCHEKMLVDAIAEEVYTIKDAKLQPCKLETVKRFSLILENAGGNHVLNTMVKYGPFYKIEAEEGLCDSMLPKLLAQGWRLRGMRGIGEEEIPGQEGRSQTTGESSDADQSAV